MEILLLRLGIVILHYEISALLIIHKYLAIAAWRLETGALISHSLCNLVLISTALLIVFNLGSGICLCLLNTFLRHFLNAIMLRCKLLGIFKFRFRAMDRSISSLFDDELPFGSYLLVCDLLQSVNYGIDELILLRALCSDLESSLDNVVAIWVSD